MAKLNIEKADLPAIAPLRAHFLEQSRFQFTYDKCHLYGWSDDYLFTADGESAGYGCVWGSERREERDSIFEFFVYAKHQRFADQLFRQLKERSRASFVECQSNDLPLTTMLFRYCTNVRAEAILFEDDLETQFVVTGAVLEETNEVADQSRYDRQYVLRLHGQTIATGGMMLNYNFPYADLYYEVNEPYRGKGLGSFFVQELKKEAYRLGRVPAARCNLRNDASRLTLLKSGFKVCGFRLRGELTAAAVT